jgi:phage repressor protein C with HTH and peptisase S24 domain
MKKQIELKTELSTADLELEKRLGQVSAIVGDRKTAALVMGISEAQLYRYLKGDGVPSLIALVRLAKTTGMALEWLATGEGPMRADEAVTPSAEEYSQIPLYAAQASAGAGSDIQEEGVAAFLAFRTAWLKQDLRANVAGLAVLLVEGESMEPTLSDGDAVLIDRAATDPSREGVYVVRIDASLLVKRLQRLPDNQVRAASDNPAYEPFTFHWPAPVHRVAIIGRVLWLGHRL